MLYTDTSALLPYYRADGVDPQWGINRFVKTLKGRSSRLLRSEFPHLKSLLPTLRTRSYFVATVGGAPGAPSARDAKRAAVV